jgi:HD-like signal output (HDOD) protein
VLLGLRNVRNLVLGIGFLEIIGHEEIQLGYPRPSFRAHSVHCGRAATLLARVHGVELHGEEFVAGLIHNFGQLVILRAYRAEVEKHLNDLRGPGDHEILEAEIRLFGVGHPEVGAWAADEWRLPPTTVAAVALHHEALPEQPVGLSLLIQGGDRIAQWFLDGGFEENRERPAAWDSDSLLRHPEITADRIRDALEGELSVA